MIKISLIKDLNNNKKISGIKITHGYYCSSSCYCDCKNKCKYRKGFMFHNWSVDVHRFFEYYFHIKLPHMLYINKEYTDLSGTTKCPFAKSRRYTCWDCKYQCGLEKCSIPYNERKRFEQIPEWAGGKCGSFEKCEWADDWDRDTGKRIWK